MKYHTPKTQKKSLLPLIIVLLTLIWLSNESIPSAAQQQDNTSQHHGYSKPDKPH
jgi:hypothetical protein